MRGLAAALTTAGSLLLVLVFSDSASAEDAATWLSRSQAARAPGATMQSGFRLRIERPGAEVLVRAGRMLRRVRDGGLSDRLVILESPESLRGLVLLSKDRKGEPADQWIYLPAYRRVRRVAVHGAGDGFVGSDFTYADFGRVRIEAGSHRVAGPGEAAGRPCVVVETVETRGVPYARQTACIDRATALPLRVEQYDDEDRLLRTARIVEIENVGGHATPVLMTVENARTGGTSAIRLHDVVYDAPLDPERFRVESLESPPPR